MSQIRATEILEEIIKNFESTPFNELKVSQRTPIIQTNGSYEISLLRDVITKDEGATVTKDGSEFVLSVDNEDSCTMLTASRGRYVPGFAAEVGVGVRIPDNNADMVWGYFDTTPDTQEINDGCVFGIDEDGFYVAVYKNTVETVKVYQEDFNISNTEIDLSKGFIFQILYVYYGYGPIFFILLHPVTNRVVNLHVVVIDEDTSLGNSNLQVGAQIKATGEASEIRLGGRQFSILGIPNFITRKVTHFREDVSIPTENFVPIMSFRRKAGRRSVPIKIHSFECISNNDIIVQWRVDSDISLDGELSFIAPSDHDENEVALEVNENATAIDMGTGLKVDEYMVLGGTGPQPRRISQGQTVADVPDEYIVTLCAKSIDSGAATASFIGKMIEER